MVGVRGVWSARGVEFVVTGWGWGWVMVGGMGGGSGWGVEVQEGRWVSRELEGEEGERAEAGRSGSGGGGVRWMGVGEWVGRGE